jgi:type IV secretory pathway TrbD component
MGADVRRALRMLAMGRSRKAILIEAAGVVAFAVPLWIIACGFVLMEPIR